MADILFKITPNPDCPTNTNPYNKVGESNFKAHYPGLNKNMAWDTLEPLIRQSQSKYIYPWICEDFFQYLADKYQNDFGNLTADELTVLEMLQDASAYYTMHLGYPILNGTLSDMGPQQNSATEGTAQPIEMWRYKNTRWEIISFADQCIDRALSFVEALPADDPLKLEYERECEGPGSLFFKTMGLLQNEIDIKSSFRTFATLAPYLRKAEKRYLLPIICEAQYLRLEIEIEDPLLATQPGLDLIEKIRCYLAPQALLMALPYLTLVIENDGLKVVSSTDGFNTKDPAYLNGLSELKATLENDVATYRANLIRFLHENKDDYPFWTASDCYTEPGTNCSLTVAEDLTGGIMF